MAPGLIVNPNQDGHAVAIEALDAQMKMGRDGLSLIEIDLQQL